MTLNERIEQARYAVEQLRREVPKNAISVNIEIDWKELGPDGDKILPVIKLSYELDVF